MIPGPLEQLDLKRPLSNDSASDSVAEQQQIGLLCAQVQAQNDGTKWVFSQGM